LPEAKTEYLAILAEQSSGRSDWFAAAGFVRARCKEGEAKINKFIGTCKDQEVVPLVLHIHSTQAA
jgi:hypothetical protein